MGAWDWFTNSCSFFGVRDGESGRPAQHWGRSQLLPTPDCARGSQAVRAPPELFCLGVNRSSVAVQNMLNPYVASSVKWRK